MTSIQTRGVKGGRTKSPDMFAGLNEESIKYTATGYEISRGVARSGAMKVWADYENAEANS